MRRLITQTDDYELWETSPGRYSIYLVGGGSLRSNLTYAEAVRIWQSLGSRSERGDVISTREDLVRLGFGGRGSGVSERERAMSEIRRLMSSGLRERGFD